MKPPTTQIPLTLTRQELDQLLEALSEHAESWERTAEALRASRSRASEGGSGNGRPGGAGKTRGQRKPIVGREPALSPQASDDEEPEDYSDEDLESQRFCMQSSLAGLTALQIAARCRKVMDKILEQADGENAVLDAETAVDC